MFNNNYDFTMKNVLLSRGAQVLEFSVFFNPSWTEIFDKSSNEGVKFFGDQEQTVKVTDFICIPVFNSIFNLLSIVTMYLCSDIGIVSRMST